MKFNPLTAMAVSSIAVTEEEFITCLHIRLYHPDQASQDLYRLLPLHRRHIQDAEDPLRLGRDVQACTFALYDPRVSRRQLSLQAYRERSTKQMLFTVQNLSQKMMQVNGTELGYLERVRLGDKALLRFGRYELLVRLQSGEALTKFEVMFEICNVPPSQEQGLSGACTMPVMESGGRGPSIQEPLESDESVTDSV